MNRMLIPKYFRGKGKSAARGLGSFCLGTRAVLSYVSLEPAKFRQ
jgi:hypothetical protein